MTSSEAKLELVKLCSRAEDIVEVAKTAQRNGKSLRGDNHYGHKFHEHLTALSSALTRAKLVLDKLTAPAATEAVANVVQSCKTLNSFDADGPTRMRAAKSIERACNATLVHALDALDAPAVPASEQVLPMAVVKGSRGYLEHMVLQANGCYERGWFDASSVMIRKFIETLIIHVYEHADRAAYIKSGGKIENDFLMLADLVEKIVNDTAFNLARECKRTLPLLKQLGDRSAHNRRYMATKADVDNIVPGLRVAADDLLHLGGLK